MLGRPLQRRRYPRVGGLPTRGELSAYVSHKFLHFPHLQQAPWLQPPSCLFTMTDTKELKASLEKHNETFETLLNLIPAKYYLPKDPDEQVGRDSRIP